MTVYRDEEEIGAVLFSAETGKSFGMNVVAEIIWENASPGADREHVFFILRREFSEVPESARTISAKFSAPCWNRAFCRNSLDPWKRVARISVPAAVEPRA